jgi:hypothetical protein
MIRFIHPAPVSSGGMIKAMFVPQQMPGWEPGQDQAIFKQESLCCRSLRSATRLLVLIDGGD